MRSLIRSIPFLAAVQSLKSLWGYEVPTKWSISLASPVDLGPYFGRKGWSCVVGRVVFATPWTLAKAEASLHMHVYFTNLNLYWQRLRGACHICGCTFTNTYSLLHTNIYIYVFNFFLLGLLSPWELWFTAILFLVIQIPFLYPPPVASFIA